MVRFRSITIDLKKMNIFIRFKGGFPTLTLDFSEISESYSRPFNLTLISYVYIQMKLRGNYSYFVSLENCLFYLFKMRVLFGGHNISDTEDKLLSAITRAWSTKLANMESGNSFERKFNIGGIPVEQWNFLIDSWPSFFVKNFNRSEEHYLKFDILSNGLTFSNVSVIYGDDKCHDEDALNELYSSLINKQIQFPGALEKYLSDTLKDSYFRSARLTTRTVDVLDDDILFNFSYESLLSDKTPAPNVPLEQFLCNTNLTLILGEPGVGKTILLQKLVLDFAGDNPPFAAIPIYVDLALYDRVLKSEKESNTLLMYAVDQFTNRNEYTINEKNRILGNLREYLDQTLFILDNIDKAVNCKTKILGEIANLKKKTKLVVAATPTDHSLFEVADQILRVKFDDALRQKEFINKLGKIYELSAESCANICYFAELIPVQNRTPLVLTCLCHLAGDLEGRDIWPLFASTLAHTLLARSLAAHGLSENEIILLEKRRRNNLNIFENILYTISLTLTNDRKDRVNTVSLFNIVETIAKEYSIEEKCDNIYLAVLDCGLLTKSNTRNDNYVFSYPFSQTNFTAIGLAKSGEWENGLLLGKGTGMRYVADTLVDILGDDYQERVRKIIRYYVEYQLDIPKMISFLSETDLRDIELNKHKISSAGKKYIKTMLNAMYIQQALTASKFAYGQHNKLKCYDTVKFPIVKYNKK